MLSVGSSEPQVLLITIIHMQGAGDAFVGALAFYLSRSSILPFQEMVYRSSKIASHTVTMPGTQSSFVVNQMPKELFE